MVILLGDSGKLNLRSRLFDRYCKINGVPPNGLSHRQFMAAYRLLKSQDADKRQQARRRLYLEDGLTV